MNVICSFKHRPNPLSTPFAIMSMARRHGSHDKNMWREKNILGKKTITKETHSKARQEAQREREKARKNESHNSIHISLYRIYHLMSTCWSRLVLWDLVAHIRNERISVERDGDSLKQHKMRWYHSISEYVVNLWHSINLCLFDAGFHWAIANWRLWHRLFAVDVSSPLVSSSSSTKKLYRPYNTNRLLSILTET